MAPTEYIQIVVVLLVNDFLNILSNVKVQQLTHFIEANFDVKNQILFNRTSLAYSMRRDKQNFYFFFLQIIWADRENIEERRCKCCCLRKVCVCLCVHKEI